MSRSRSPSPRSPAARDTRDAPRDVQDESNKLFIGNLSFQTEDRDLEDAFSRYGKVVEARVMVDRDTGRPRGFGFVTFESVASADDAITGMNNFELQGREIRVDRSTPRGQGPRRDGPGGRGGGGGGFGGGGGDRSCHDFQRGNCSYGDRCKFSHGDSGGGGGGRPRYEDRGSRGGYEDRGRDDRRGGGRDDYRSGGRDDRRGGGYDDRRGGYDDRRGGGDDRRGGGGYDDRRGRDDRDGGHGGFGSRY